MFRSSIGTTSLHGFFDQSNMIPSLVEPLKSTAIFWVENGFQRDKVDHVSSIITPPQFSIAPEKGPFQDERFFFQSSFFRGKLLSFPRYQTPEAIWPASLMYIP